MLRKKNSIHFKCPSCGYETQDQRPEIHNMVTCPQCGSKAKKKPALLASLLVGLGFGLLISVLGLIVFAITHARPIYVVMMIALPIWLIAIFLSPSIRKHTAYWKKE